jgi:pimeloyl-ACP methyl ester carboxylesterase
MNSDRASLLDVAHRPLDHALVSSATLPSAAPSYDEPTGVAPRGTLILLTGRGEPATIYQRFGRRIAADAYRVRIVETRLGDLDGTRRDVAALIEDDALPSPKILAGSDAGAVYAALLSTELEADAVILAGLALPDGDGPDPDDTWELELELRTACPAHRGVLAGEPGVRRGRLADPLPARLADAVDRPTVPTLIVHGAEDAVAPAAEALGSLAGAPGVEAVLIAGGRHDILNDVTHRSVAATIVLFLERLRLGPELPAIVLDADLT